jgi:hypothetical protein
LTEAMTSSRMAADSGAVLVALALGLVEVVVSVMFVS